MVATASTSLAPASDIPLLSILCIIAVVAITTGAMAADAIEVRPPQRDTVVVDDGQSMTAVIARMDDPEIAAAARTLAVAIGHDTEIINEQTVLGLDEDVAAELQNRHLVLVGNAHNNRAIFRLYIRELALCDHDYPGRGGWIIRTVCDPWTAGHNAIIVGASDDAQLQEAAAQFQAALTTDGATVTLPWAWRFESGLGGDAAPLYSPRSYTDDEWAEYNQKITYVDQPINQFPEPVILEAMDAADAHFHTGSEAELRRFKLAIEQLQELGDRLAPARRVEFRIKDLVIAWERIEASPFFTPQDRTDIATFLYDIGCLWEDKYWSAPKMTERVREVGAMYNHSSNGTLGYLRLAMYLTRRCKLSGEAAGDVQNWLESAVDVFGVQERSFKPREDANGYQWWTVKHMLKYAMWKPDLDFVWNGNLRLTTDLVLAVADNLSNAAGFGDVGDRLLGYTSHAHYICSLAVHHYGDGCARWISEFLGGSYSDREMPVDSMEPVDSTGVVKIPWSRSIYDTKAQRDTDCARVPWSRTFDKIAFRSSFDPQDPYMLLDGIGGMNHGHDDCNAITRVTARSQIWLLDAGGPLKTMYDHNGVFVARNGQSPVEAYTAELRTFADCLTAGMTKTESLANGLIWNRNIFWDKAGYFVVVDALDCEKSGEYQANCIWRSRYEGTLDGDTYTAVSHGDRMTITSDGSGMPKTGWERHDNAADAHVLRQILSQNMRAGDRFAYANVLAWPDDGEDALELSKVADATWRVNHGDGSTVVATGSDMPPGIDTDARMLMITPQAICLVDATGCSLWGTPVLSASEPVTIELGRSGRGLVMCSEGTAVSLPADGEINVNGETLSLQPAEELSEAEFPVGRHVINYDASRLSALLDTVQEKSSSWQRIDTGVEAGEQAPTSGQTLWRFDGLREYVPIEIVDTVATPPCRPGRSSPVNKLFDGKWGGSGNSGIWQPGAKPVVMVDLGETRTIDRIEIYTWEGMDNTQLSSVSMSVSQQDAPESFEPVADNIPIIGQAERDISRIRRAGGLDVTGRYVKLRFKPAGPEHAPYIAEVVLHPPADQLLGKGEINDIAVFDIDRDGAAEVLIAGSDEKIHCLRGDGETLWQFEAQEPFEAVWAGDIDGDVVLLAGCDDNHLYRLDPRGEVIWQQRTYDYRPRPHQTGKVKQIEVAQLTPDGPPVILTGADNWHLSAFTLDGDELWHCWYYAHLTSFITTGDLDGDGAREIFQGTSFADTNWFETAGEESHFQFTHMGPTTDGVTADLDGDGKEEMIAVGQKGVVATTACVEEDGGREWQEQWRIQTGCPQTSVVVADANDDGKDDIITAGKNGFIQAVGTGGAVHWVRNAENSINDLLIADIDGTGRSSILAGSDDGTVQVWSLDGELQRRVEVGEQVVRVRVADIDGDGKQEIIAVTVSDLLHAVQP